VVVGVAGGGDVEEFFHGCFFLLVWGKDNAPPHPSAPRNAPFGYTRYGGAENNFWLNQFRGHFFVDRMYGSLHNFCLP
jgi:hypothetical protein